MSVEIGYWKVTDKTRVSKGFSVNNSQVTSPKYRNECWYLTIVGCDLASQIPDPMKPYTTYLKHWRIILLL